MNLLARSSGFESLSLNLGDLVAHYWPVGAGAFLVALIATPLCRSFALKRKIVDRPDDFLKPHKRPIPYLGGVAIFMGWGCGVLMGFLRFDMPPATLAYFVAGLAIMLIGLFDDLRVTRPRTKLLANIAVAVWLIYFGLGGDVVRVLTDLARLKLDSPLETAAVMIYSVPVAVFVIVGACNAANLLDGLDGLCGGVLGIISVGFLILAVHLALLYPPVGSDDQQRIVLSLSMLGAAAGFLPYNRSPATIFMGDAGSMLLGLNAAMLILLFAEAGLVRWLIGALIVFGLPIADMLLTLVRRWRNAKPLMQGDRSHFYDQLIDRGLSVRQVVAISYGATIFFVAFGCMVIFIRTMIAILIYLLLMAAVVVVVGKLRMVALESPRTDTRSR